MKNRGGGWRDGPAAMNVHHLCRDQILVPSLNVKCLTLPMTPVLRNLKSSVLFQASKVIPKTLVEKGGGKVRNGGGRGKKGEGRGEGEGRHTTNILKIEEKL